jgi:hypothetical protein
MCMYQYMYVCVYVCDVFVVRACEFRYSGNNLSNRLH